MRTYQIYLSICAMVFVGVSGIATVKADTVTVTQGQSMWSIAQEEGVSLQALEAANPNVDPNSLQVGTELQVPTSTSTTSTPATYVVTRGDTLFTIAQRYGVSVSKIESLNPTVDPQNLPIGSSIRIPSGAVAQRNSASTNASSHSSSSSNSNSTSSDSNVSSSDLYWMEHVIHAEASSEPLAAQIAVGDVILHRLQAGTYGKTIKDVIFQETDGQYQFGCVPNGEIYTTPTKQNDDAAIDVLEHDKDVVPGALVFYNPNQTGNSTWILQQPSVASIGDFVFAK